MWAVGELRAMGEVGGVWVGLVGEEVVEGRTLVADRRGVWGPLVLDRAISAEQVRAMEVALGRRALMLVEVSCRDKVSVDVSMAIQLLCGKVNFLESFFCS